MLEARALLSFFGFVQRLYLDGEAAESSELEDGGLWRMVILVVQPADLD